MPLHDFLFVVIWWAVLLSIGAIFFPITSLLFRKFLDRGYIFSKILGAAICSYLVLLLGILHVAVFSQITIFFVLVGCALVQFFLIAKYKRGTRRKLQEILFSSTTLLILTEEILFFAGLLFWSFIRAHQPDIHGLEKFMDYGFVNSILRSQYFPPQDMWLPPNSINYYYFGHLVTAVLTKLSAIPSSVSFNLMIATLFSLTLLGGFSLGGNLWTQLLMQLKKSKRLGLAFIMSGLLSGLLLSCAGNFHTLYSFFTPYENEHPVPLWQLKFSPTTFPNSYWYPNATRFIYHTIHEFPIYSFVVSDLHGHVVDIPFVLLTIAVIFSLFLVSKEEILQKLSSKDTFWQRLHQHMPLFSLWVFVGFLLAIMYMTNALDGLIYMLLAGVSAIFLYMKYYQKNLVAVFFQTPVVSVFILLLGTFVVFSLPFSLFFKSFVSQIGLVCPPDFLIKLQSIGPFVFEQNHCDHSPWWQLLILYGFFGIWIIFLITALIKTKRTIIDYFALIVAAVSVLLIIVPEFFYLRDIYTTYYRANTMFKLVYQAFIMLSLVSAYAFARSVIRFPLSKNIFKSLAAIVVLLVGVITISLVGIYPYFAVGSYYNNLKTYVSLDGLGYLSRLYPDDYQAILWINTHIQDQPVMVEAPGDSYTDYERISANTGLPTVLGWSVHEWLWRGTYDVVPPRATDIQTLYETTDLATAKLLLKKYHIAYVYVGTLERQKYPHLSEAKFQTLGQIVYQHGVTTIYQLSF